VPKTYGPPRRQVVSAIRSCQSASTHPACGRGPGAAMSMARLWRDQGKRNEARELLAPVYGWFIEGFDTRDLREAKTLLDELR